MRIVTIILLLTSLSAVGQALPDSIVITNNSYVPDDIVGDKIYRTTNYSIVCDGKKFSLNGKRIGKSKILAFQKELSNPTNTDNSLGKYEIDTSRLKNNPEILLSLYSDKKRIEWNEQQKEFIFKKLTDLSLYKKELSHLQDIGSYYSMHRHFKDEFIVKLYNKGIVTQEIKSRKYAWGYQMPWTNQSGETLYNFKIESKLKDILSIKNKIRAPLKGEKFEKYLVNRIVELSMSSLYQLASHSYLKEINELKSDFTIVSHEEVYGRGRYIWKEPKTMKIVLKNKLMLENVRLNFLASKQGDTLYSRDSIKRDYAGIIQRIQSINFISEYLKSNPATTLDIYYFNNKGINKYNMDGINKNPEEWEKHDAFMESIKRYDTVANKPSFANEDAIRVSKELYCGCNYRFNNDFLEQAIFFELNDSSKNNSVWFLLPDNRVLLYLMQGDKVLNYDYTDFGKFSGIQYPCKLFDMKGQIISN